MNNFSFDTFIGKAAVCVCLFLFYSGGLFSQDLPFTLDIERIYHSALNLNSTTVNQEATVAETYVASFAEATELLVTEDQARYAEYEERFLKRLDKNIKASPRDYQFVQAEIRLHWAFVYLKFGHELDAALRLREAYQIAEACRERFPEYIPIRKTSGLLQVIVGSVPDKYNWVLSLLNMRGSVSAGLAELQDVAMSKSVLATEGKMLHALVKGFILSKPAEGLAEMQQVLAEHQRIRLALFLGASLALKNSSNEVALAFLKELAQNTTGIPLYYADYLRGEAFLHKGDYLNSISAYRWFINHQPGQNYIKDAYYKMGLCYWLNGNENDALAIFAEAREKGKEATEADKAAARSLSEKAPPNVKLSRIRYLTDGGYYQEAEQLLSGITSLDLNGPKDDAEYYYRKARLSHKMDGPDVIDLYLETIRMTGQESWYFAPHACLQLGYIYQSQNRVKEAAEYFQRALSYRRHEYKNSIDSKARSALAQLGRM